MIAFIEPTAWRERCREAQANGTFTTLYVVNANDDERAGEASFAVRALFTGRNGTEVLSCPIVSGQVPSIVEQTPAAAWSEREAHDAYGVDFEGHRPLRPFLEHTPDLAAWTIPVRGGDAYHVAVGPIHAGVIESGHFRFHAVGERILHIDVRLFYKHRGIERAAEGSPLHEGIAFAQRACGACAISNSLAYAHACESITGLTPSRELARVRTLLLELERLYNHLNDIGAVCAGVGFAAGSAAFAALKERAHRVNSLLTGHRFLFGSIAVGESTLEIAADDAAAARAELAALGRTAAEAWDEILFNASVQDRFRDFGPLTREQALAVGAVGPAARASGVARDARLFSRDRLHYPGFTATMLSEPTGDVSSRVRQRARELTPTLASLDELLRGAHRPASAVHTKPKQPLGVGLIESPRGETACVVEAVEGRIARLHLRTSSYTNWPALALAATGQIFPDFPLINKSFELCYACTDR